MTIEAIPEDMSWLTLPSTTQMDAAHLIVYLAFDLSGSMSGEPLREAQNAARGFVEQIDLAYNLIGLISFADRCETTVSACQNADILMHGINRLSVGSVGGGNSTDPFDHVRSLLKGVKDSRYVLVLADGVWSHQDRAVRAAKACHQDGIEIISIGFGGADRRFLEQIATTSLGNFHTSLSNLVETFSTITQAITESGRGLRM